MRAARASALVEILTVIAVVSILVSVGLPSLGRAKDVALRVICQSNLHQIGVAIDAYAAGHRSAVPLYCSRNADPPPHPWETYCAYGDWDQPPPPGQAPGQGPGQDQRASFNLALLAECGYATAPKLFYCPSQTAAPLSWDEPQRSLVGDGHPYSEIWYMPVRDRRELLVRVGYHYNPHRGLWAARRYMRLADFRADEALGLDIMVSQQWTAHADVPGWAVMFAGGHVQFKENQHLYEDIGAAGALLGQYFGTEHDQQDDHDCLFICALNRLETE